MKYKNVSIIIQGPISKTTLFAIAKYKDLAEIIISFCSQDNQPEYLKSFCQNNIKIVTYNNADVAQAKKNLNSKNECYQFYSTKIAIDNSEKEFCIKTRSDEYYEKLDFFIDEVIKNKEKVCVSNIFFRKFEYWKFSASDHIIGTKTDLFKNAFDKLWESVNLQNIFERNIKYNYNYCLKLNNNWYEPIPKNWIAPEQYITISFLNAFKEHYQIQKNTDVFNYNFFKKNFKIIDVNNLKNYKVVCNTNAHGKPKFWTNDFTIDTKYDLSEEFNN